MFLKTYRQLSQKKIVGMNARNLDYVQMFNTHKAIRKADDKLVTKQLAIKNGIPVSELYHVIECEAEIADLEKILSQYPDFVIKPNRGSGGKGILIISETSKQKFRKMSGHILGIEQLKNHILNILSGIHSMGGYRDKAVIEYRIQCDPVFNSISYRGVPDIRIIAIKGFPMMAMARLPTISSDGKANLHQGAIGLGIDVTTGITISGVMGNETVKEHPDTLNSIIGIQIPYWDEMLEMAAKCYEVTGLGYYGIDIVIDKNLGPLLLELNAHPGLNIQIANQDGIGRCHDCLAPCFDEEYDYQERIAISKKVLVRIF